MRQVLENFALETVVIVRMQRTPGNVGGFETVPREPVIMLAHIDGLRVVRRMIGMKGDAQRHQRERGHGKPGERKQQPTARPGTPEAAP